MRFTASLMAGLLLAGCSQASTGQPRWRPTPIAGAVEPSVVIANSSTAEWQDIPAENLMVMDLPDGRVIIELAPHFAPVHAANMRAFARAGWWNNATIYRMQDNYVAQWGNGDAEVTLPAGVVQRPPAEYERQLAGLEVTELGYPDPYAAATGYSGGWPIAFDRQEGLVWLPHCYGSVGVGRDLAPDTGTGGELYAVIGHAPRHLDRNIANVGRVIEGMALLSARTRGTGNLGFYQIDRGETPIRIARVRMASDMPAAERPRFEAMRTGTPTFANYVRGRANRGGTFFNRPAGGVDICNAQVPVRRRGI